jgi:hypothetical protein
METATQIDSLDHSVPAAPIRTPIRLAPPETGVLADDEAVRADAAQVERTATEEFYCAQCRFAKFDRARSLCLCTSPVAEFARQTIFAGQTACGWFKMRPKRVLKWSLASGRMF